MCPEARKRHSLLLSLDQTSDGRAAESIQNAPCSTDTQILQVHMARRQITRAGFHCVQLFHIASDKGVFHNRRYKKADATEPCDHFDTLNQDGIETTWAKCVTGENGFDWIKCPKCSQWYHDGCVYAFLKHFLLNVLIYLVRYIALKLVKSFYVGQTYLKILYQIVQINI